MLKILCDSAYQNVLDKGWSNPKDLSATIRIALQIFSEEYYNFFFKQRHNKSFRTRLLSARLRAQEIQANLIAGTDVSRGTLVQRWLKSINWFKRVETYDEELSRERYNSYAILTFPYQRTLENKKRDILWINYWEGVQVKGKELLCKFLDQMKSIESLEDKWALNKLLSMHEAFVGITWLQLLADFSQNNPPVTIKINKLIQSYEKVVTLNLPKPCNKSVEQSSTFKNYVARRTLELIKEKYPIDNKFEQTLLCLCEENEKARSDIAFFLAKGPLHKSEKRDSDYCLSVFRLYDCYVNNDALSQKQKESVMRWIVSSNFEEDDAFSKYIPSESRSLDGNLNESIDTICSMETAWCSEEIRKGYKLHLMGAFALHPEWRNLFPYTALTCLEILRFLQENVEAKKQHYDAYTKENDVKFEEKIAEASEFTEEEKPYLYALYKTDKHFPNYLEFLSCLAKTTGKKFGHSTAFHFLLCGLKTSVNVNSQTRPVWQNLMEFAKQVGTKKKLMEEKLVQIRQLMKSIESNLRKGAEELLSQAAIFVNLKDGLSDVLGRILNEMLFQLTKVEQQNFIAQFQEELFQNVFGNTSGNDFVFEEE